jgi:hypothetical protein
MSNRIPLVVAGAALALVALQQIQLGSLKRSLGSGDSRGVAGSDGKPDDLRERVEILEERVQRLGRVALNDPRAGGSGPALSPEEIEALKEDVSAAAVDRALVSGEGRERLRSAIREEQNALDEERRQERSQRMKQMREERLAKFVAEANLSPEQAKSVTGTYEEEWKTMQSLFEEVRGGAKSWQEVRGEIRTIREATDAKVEDTLSSQQFSAWAAMRAENGPGAVGGGGGPGGPN